MEFSTQGVQDTLVARNTKQGLDEAQENGDCIGEVAGIIPIAEEEEEVVEMNQSESPADEPSTSPIPIDQLSLGQFPEYRQYVRDRAETDKKDNNNYCRRLLPLKSKVRAVGRFSQLEELRRLEGTFGDPTLFGPSATRTCYTNEGDQELLEVRLKDYPFLKNTLLIIHKLVAYSSTESPQEPNICYLPTKSTNDTQVYEIARSTEAPAQVDVQLKTNYVYEEEEEEQPDSQPVAQEYSESPAVNSVAMLCKSERNASSQVTFTSSTGNFLVNPTIGVSSSTPSILQSVCNPNAIIITKGNTSHIVSASSLGQTAIIANAPAVIQRELLVQGVANTRLVVASASALEEAMTKSKEEAEDSAKTDVTTDGETSRPGHVTVCHNCGTQSRNLHCCDSCRRTIPRGSRVMPDRTQQSLLAGIRVAPGINSTLISPKKSPTRKKRQGKPKPEEITLSSDEESCESSPEKKAKLHSDTITSDANHSTTTTSASTPPQTTANSDDVKNGAAKKEEEATAHDPNDEIAMTDSKALDVEKVRETMLAKMKSNSGSYIKLKCRSFRVGTYKCVDLHVHDDPNFVATISDEGVMFRMPHYSKVNKMEQLVIPTKAILQMLACFESRKSPFLILHVGNKIARWIRETLGMITKAKGWFDPVAGGNRAEKSIVVMVDAFKPEDVAFINKTYSTTVNDVDPIKANQILMDIAVESSAAVNTNNTVTSAVVVNSLVQVGKLSTPVVTRPIDPSKVSSSSSSKPASCNVIPGIKKSNLRSQQDKQKNGKLAGSKAGEDPLIDGTKTILTGKNKKLIPLHQLDLMTLRPEQFLNDQIIDFWLLYVYHHLLSESDRARTHIFNQFFYNRLTQKPRDSTLENYKATAAEKRHRRVKKWTKNVDLFSKDFIIVPINDSCHWYVAIICFPGLKGPHWMDDGTPIENWQNLSKESGKPKFTRPPGMPPRVDDLPPKRRKKKPQEGPPDESAGIAEGDKPANGIGGSHATDLDGNPILPDEASREAAVPSAAEDGKIPEKQQDKVPVTKGTAAATTTDGNKKDNNTPVQAPITLKVAAKPTGHAALLDESALFDDPFKDEAKDDSDEENLINEYFYDDESDEESEEGSENVPTESPTDPPAEEAKTNSVGSQESADKDEKMEVSEEEAVGDGRKDFRIKQPCILLFNSLFGTARTRVFTTLREYLQVEYKERKGEERQFSKFDMPGFEPNVPQQKNMCDCGVYLFEYVERFFSDPLDSYLLALPSSLRKWFPQLKTKRKDMYDKICDMVKEENPENMKYVPKFDVPPPPPPPPPPEPRSIPGKERKVDIKPGHCLVASAISYQERLVKAKVGGVMAAEKMDTSEETFLKGHKVEIKSGLLPQNRIITITKAKGGGGVILKNMDTAVETPAKGRKPAGKARILAAPRIPKVAAASVRKVVVKKVTKINSQVPSQEVCDTSKKGIEIPITIEKSPATETVGIDATQKGSHEGETPSTSTPTKKVSKGRRASSSKPKDEPTASPERTDSKSVAPEPAPEATVAQVEAAPRQKLIPVAPEEEPMEIDPVAEES